MSAEIDPYREWLGIKSPDRPLNYYQLLDLKLYESDRERIENAEMLQMAKVLRHERGPAAALAARIGSELEAAVKCLLDPVEKAAYDADLFVAPKSPPAASAGIVAQPPVVEPAQNLSVKEAYDFASDLKLSEDEEDAATDDDYTDLKLPEEEEPESDTPVAPAARQQISREDDEPEPQRPSLMKMLEPGKAREPDKPEAASGKNASHASYDPPPIPKKSLLPALSLPTVSGKTIAAAAVVVALAAALWFLPGMLSPAGPDAGKILGKIAAADPQTRIEGIDSLQELELSPNEAAALLVKVLKEDSADAVRIAAVNALVNNGSPAPDVASQLKELLKTEKHANVKSMLKWLTESPSPR